MQKHATTRTAPGLGHYACACLEGQIADLADEIAYYAHDLQDGLEAGLIQPGQLSDVALCADISRENGLDLTGTDAKTARLSLARLLSNHLIHDVLEASAARIAAAKVQSADDVRRHADLLIGYSARTASEAKALRSFLYANLYFHPEVNNANQRACDMMADVFNAYIKDPSQIGREATRRVPNCGLYRAAGDYIAGMTDRYLLREHARLFDRA
jgi:dGTPase